MGNGFSATGSVHKGDIVSMEPLNSNTLRKAGEGLNEAVGKAWSAARRQFEKYGLRGDEIDMYVAEMSPNSGVLGFCIIGSPDSNEIGRVAINGEHLNMNNDEYDMNVKVGHNADRGSKSAVEMIFAHEFGHRMTMAIAKDRSISYNEAAEQIVSQAMRRAGLKGGWKNAAGKISSYAQTNQREAISEAMASYYAHGQNASAFARGVEATIKEMMKMRR